MRVRQNLRVRANLLRAKGRLPPERSNPPLRQALRQHFQRRTCSTSLRWEPLLERLRRSIRLQTLLLHFRRERCPRARSIQP